MLYISICSYHAINKTSKVITFQNQNSFKLYSKMSKIHTGKFQCLSKKLAIQLSKIVGKHLT